MNESILQSIGLGHLIERLTPGKAPWFLLESEATKITVRDAENEPGTAIEAWPVTDTRFLCVASPLLGEPPLWFGELFETRKLANGTYINLGMVEPLLMKHYEWDSSFGRHGSKESEAILNCGGEWESLLSNAMPIMVHIPVAKVDEFLVTWGSQVTELDPPGGW